MRLVVAIFVIVMLAAAMPAALSATLDESGTQTIVVNETFTPGTGSPITLNESERDDVLYNRTVTVYNSSGVLVTQPSNYTWIKSNGTIDVQAGGTLDGEPSANITYGYLDTTEDHLMLTTLFGQIPSVVGLALPVFGVLLFIRAFAGGL